jgi:predicted  nucleic acid-binding Zn-ribbon protein
MALIQRSTLVDAPTNTKVEKNILTMNGKVNTNEVVVDKKADALYNAIYKNYTELNKYFQAIAAEYRNCANKSVKGQKLVASLKKVAKNCENQGKYCLNRQKNLKTLYTKAVTEKNTNELNNAIDSLQADNKDLSSNYTTLQNDTNALKTSYNDLQGSYNSLHESYTNLTNNYNEVSEQLKKLQDVVDSLSRNSK